MALAPDFATTYAKAMRAAGLRLPERPNGHRAVAFLSVCDRDKPAATLLAQRLTDLGFDLVATPGTARRIEQLGIEVTEVAKVGADDGNSVVDLVRGGKVDLIVNTPVGRGARADGYQIRRAAISAKVPCITTLAGAAQPCRRSRAPGRSSPRACRSCTLDALRAWRPASRWGRTCRSGWSARSSRRRARASSTCCARSRTTRLLARPLSAVASDDAGVTFLCQPRGPALAALAQVGAEVEVLGPFGHGFDPRAAGAAPLLVGGGFGVALLAPLARACLPRPAARRLPRRGRGACRRARAAAEREIALPPANVLELLAPRLPGVSSVFAAGPDGLVRAVAAACAARGRRPARSRSRRRWPAATAPATAARCASAGGSCGSASRARSWRAIAWWRRERRSLARASARSSSSTRS